MIGDKYVVSIARRMHFCIINVVKVNFSPISPMAASASISSEVDGFLEPCRIDISELRWCHLSQFILLLLFVKKVDDYSVYIPRFIFKTLKRG